MRRYWRRKDTKCCNKDVRWYRTFRYGLRCLKKDFNIKTILIKLLQSVLRKAFAEVIKKICSVKNQSSNLEAFLACRLIPLDKNSGLWAIGVGEVLRRITGKAVVTHIRTNIITLVGSLQVCAGQEAGCDSIIHVMCVIQTCEAVLLVDASNAFNLINRNVFLYNVTMICPAIAIYVKNCHRGQQNQIALRINSNCGFGQIYWRNP